MKSVWNYQFFLKHRFVIQHDYHIPILTCTDRLKFTLKTGLYNEEIGVDVKTFIIMFSDFNVTDEMTIIMLIESVDMP